MDHSELGEAYNGFRFKLLEPEEYDEALEFMEKHLYPSLIPLGYKAENAEDWNNIFRAMMENGTNLSYLAKHVESGEIAACRMVDLIDKDKPHAPPAIIHKGNLDILKIIVAVSAEEDLFGKYGITQYPDMFGLCVDPKFRKMGIATEMYRRGLAFLKGRGFKIVKCGFVSPYSRRAGLKSGYKEFGRRHFHECKDDDGNILNPDSDPTDYVCLGVFNLE